MSISDLLMTVRRGLRGTVIFGFLGLLLLHSGLAAAQTAPPQQPGATDKSVLDRIRAKQRELKPNYTEAQRWFDNLDIDKSGDISKQELYEGVRRRFEAMDKNKDGFVSQSEYTGFRNDGETGSSRFGQLDTNKDGRLDMTEFVAPADWRFDRIDRNLDGRISRPEADRLFDRTNASRDRDGRCFYVERQIVRVDEKTAEKLENKGFARADCEWRPDVADQEKAKKSLK
jgi:hypothetical protein